MHYSWKRWSPINDITDAAATHFCVKTWKTATNWKACNRNSKGIIELLPYGFDIDFGLDWSPRVEGETIKIDFFIANPTL